MKDEVKVPSGTAEKIRLKIFHSHGLSFFSSRNQLPEIEKAVEICHKVRYPSIVIEELDESLLSRNSILMTTTRSIQPAICELERMFQAFAIVFCDELFSGFNAETVPMTIITILPKGRLNAIAL